MRASATLLLCAAMLSTAAPQRFAFSPGAPSGFTQVTPDAVYTAATGYGYDLKTTPASGRPFYFSVNETEGNYRVTLQLGDPVASCITTVKAESRRLMIEQLYSAPGQIVTRDIVVNVRNAGVPPPPANAPGGDRVRLNDREQGALHWDDKLTLEFNGGHPCVRAIELEKVDLPTIFIAGDSTVTDQPSEPYASWGQMLPRFFKPDIAVANHAESGETLKSFVTGLRLDKLLSQMKSGDYLLIQFGHNDMKDNWPQTYAEASTTYKAYLKVFIAEARRRSATPVLVTPMQRRQFDGAGKIRNSLGDYPEAMRQTAREENVALIDLNAMSVAFYEALGPAKSPLAFADNGRDATHHSPYGAYELAKCVVEGIRAESLRSTHLDLAQHLSGDAAHFDPVHPDPPESWRLPLDPQFEARPARETKGRN
jgi:lysophospholipase L1-like esterase